MLLLFRIVTLFMGSFALALTVIVLLLFLRLRGVFPSNVPLYHVPLVAASHALLIISSMAAILFRVHSGERFAWWPTPISFLAFLFTSIILVQMLRSNRLRKLHTKIEKGGESDF